MGSSLNATLRTHSAGMVHNFSGPCVDQDLFTTIQLHLQKEAFRLLVKGCTKRDGTLAMAFDEYISMHRKCLLICGYTFFLRQSAFIKMLIDGKCYFWASTKFKHA